MKNIVLFIEEIKSCYKKAIHGNNKMIDDNLPLNVGTTAVPFRHYRFFLEVPGLDHELLAMLQDNNLCPDKEYFKDSKIFHVIPETTLQNCSEQVAEKILREFSNYVDSCLSAWSVIVRRQLEQELEIIRCTLPLTIALSYSYFPPEVQITTSQSSVLNAVSAFLLTCNVKSRQMNTVNSGSENPLNKVVFTMACPQEGLILLRKLREFCSAFLNIDQISVLKSTVQELRQEKAELKNFFVTMLQQHQDPKDIVEQLRQVLSPANQEKASSAADSPIHNLAELTDFSTNPVFELSKRFGSPIHRDLPVKKPRMDEQEALSPNNPN